MAAAAIVPMAVRVSLVVWMAGIFLTDLDPAPGDKRRLGPGPPVQGSALIAGRVDALARDHAL